MGLIRKLTSTMTGGAVDFRSDKERTARNTGKMAKEAKKQTALMGKQGEDNVSKLERLARLRDQGAISAQEFEAQKKKLLKG
jgi:hypothetical protein